MALHMKAEGYKGSGALPKARHVLTRMGKADLLQ